MRLRNLQLSYIIPQKIYRKVPINGLKAGFGVQNLVTLTKYKGYDPEVGLFVVDANNTIPGMDYGRYPLSPMYSFNLVFDF